LDTSTSIDNKGVNRILVLAMGMLGMMTSGIGYAWSVIQPYVMEHYALDGSAASVPFSISLGVFVIGSIFGGKLQARMPLNRVLLIGIVINATGMFLSGLVPVGMSWLLTVSFGIIMGIGGGAVYNTMVAAMQKYFPDKLGMATGAILSTIGLSGFVISPLISFLLKNYNLTIMFSAIAAITLAIGLVSCMFVKNPPAGYMQNYKPATTTRVQSTSKQYSPNEMLKTRHYYTILISFFLAVPGFMLINPQFVVLSSERLITGAQALTAVMLASVLQAAGRIVVPSISDKIGRKITLVTVFILSAATISGLVVAKGLLYPALFIALAFLYGGFLGTYPALSTDYFGTKNAGINYALVMVGFGLASVLCPVLVRAVKGTELGTALSFAIAGGASLVGLVLMLSLKKPK
jgi:OFA family oxalate/formate antiporter-like MFS transporter